MNLHTSYLFDLTDRVAIITGGYKGLGLVFAEALAEMGAKIVLCGRNIESYQQNFEELKLIGADVLAIKCDVTDPSDVQSLVNKTIERYGKIDILVNNAGSAWGSSPEKMSLKDWERVISINLTGTFLCSQAAGKIMIEQKQGKIINISSIAGLRGDNPKSLDAIAYNASKGGVLSFTRDLACKWAKHRILVNAIAPGVFAVGITRSILHSEKEDFYLARIPLGRFGYKDDLKGSIVFLASDASNYITGQVLVIDGGATSWW